MKKFPGKKAVILLLLLALGLWILWGNRTPEVTEYTVLSDRIPQSFDGIRIAQISDLHNARFGAQNRRLLDLLARAQPDVIVLTGDLIDSRRTDVQTALEFSREAVKLAPVYYVSGNHEARVADYEDLKKGLLEAGVTVLENEKTRLTREGEYITLLGIEDPSFRAEYLFGDAASVTRKALAQLQDPSDGYSVLLSHRPELFDLYADGGIDLVFSGHAHGGQFRLPFIGGLFAPNQGLFPEYDAGTFTRDQTTMLVSRGVGNSIFPIRFCNRPQILVGVLKTGNDSSAARKEFS